MTSREIKLAPEILAPTVASRHISTTNVTQPHHHPNPQALNSEQWKPKPPRPLKTANPSRKSSGPNQKKAKRYVFGDVTVQYTCHDIESFENEDILDYDITY